MKITPAHDHNDYEVGLRHNLPFITIFTDDGIMNDKCGQFKVCFYFDLYNCSLRFLECQNVFLFC